MRIGRVEQHGCADAILTFGAFQDIVVHATVATPPESLIVRQVGERNRYISQLGIHLHHGSAGGKAEYLRLRPAHAGKLEVMSLMRFAIPKPRKSGCTIKPEVVTYCLFPHDSI